jgi:hypothetical protein
MKVSLMPGKVLFAAGVLGALGFGAAQAVAGPAPASLEAACNARCFLDCAARGFGGGECSTGGGCACWDVQW